MSTQDELLKMLAKQGIDPHEIQKKIAEVEKPAEIRSIERKREAERERKEKEAQISSEEKQQQDEGRKHLRRLQAQQKLRSVVEQKTDEKGNPEYPLEIAYLGKYYQETGRNDTTLTDLYELIDHSQAIADVVYALTSNETIHRSPEELLKITVLLQYEATREMQRGVPNARNAVKPLIDALNQHVADYYKKQYEQDNDMHLQRYRKEKDWAEWAKEQFNLSDEELKPIVDSSKDTEESMQRAVDAMVTSAAKGADTAREWAQDVAEPHPGEFIVPEEFERKLDRLWKERVLLNKGKLDATALKRIEEEILALQASSYPTAVFSGTPEYQAALDQIHAATEGKLNALGRQLVEKMAEEGPAMRVMSTEEFLKAMTEPGHFYALLRENADMKNLLLSHSEEGQRFRDQVFLKLHAGVLTFRRDSTQDTFGLYQRGDFDVFINYIRGSMPFRKDTRTGKPVGQYWAEHYTNLSNAIRLSRDIDYNASQPGANMESFARIAALYQNEYVIEALKLPAVEQAFRAYETTLRAIMDANDGYIPPALVEYDAVGRTSFWDDKAQEMLLKMASQGVLFDVARDSKNSFLHEVDKDGITVKLDENKKRQGDFKEQLENDQEGLQLAMYMTLAKGFGMATLRYLEIFANSKIPGSDSSPHGMPGFHSIAGYEGTASALNYVSVVFQKFKIGDVRYNAIFNMLAPDKDGKPLPINAKEAWEAYIAYRDGTFEEKYGKDAKRLLDIFNFSRVSSSLGANYTKWRFMDSSINWTDKDKELLGGPARIMLGGIYAGKKAEDYLVIDHFKQLYRRELERQNETLREAGKAAYPTVGPRFEALWENQGKSRYDRDINRLLNEFHGKTTDGKKVHNNLTHEYDHLVGNYQKAYNARVWVEMAMRNPLVVAHNVKVDVPIVGFPNEKKKISLHNLIVQEILGIPPEDMQYATVLEEGPNGEYHLKQSAGKYTSPTEEQRGYLNSLLDLEGDMATVREIAIREHRDLKLEDFDVISGPNETVRKNRAKEYWAMCRQVMLGSTDINRAEELYNEFGLTFAKNGDYKGGDYVIDWDKIHHIGNKKDRNHDPFVHAAQHATEYKFHTVAGEVKLPMLLTEEFASKEWDWMFGTDDIALRQMDIKNLGSRSWFRRAGSDVPGHVNGGGKMVQFVDMLTPHPDRAKLAGILKEVVQAYAADDVTRGWDVAGMLAYATDKFYAMDWGWGKLGSAAQQLFGRVGTESWGANERWHWWHELEHMSVLPPDGHDFWMDPHPFNVHDMMRQTKSSIKDVIIEMAWKIALAAILIQLWRGVTADEEEGGGGGGHH